MAALLGGVPIESGAQSWWFGVAGRIWLDRISKDSQDFF